MGKQGKQLISSVLIGIGFYVLALVALLWAIGQLVMIEKTGIIGFTGVGAALIFAGFGSRFLDH